MPSSRSVPRCLPVRSAGPGHVQHVVEQLEREPDALAELAQQRDVAAAGQRAQLTRGAEEPRGLEVAAAQVALARGLQLPGVLALQQLAWTSADEASESTRTGSAAPPPASSANARENSRSPVAVAIERPAEATTVGRPRRSTAASSTSSWTSVARCTSSTATAARNAASRPAGSGPAATKTSSGRSRLPPAAIVAQACSPSVVPCERATVETLLQVAHQPRDVRAPRLDDRGDRLGARH